MVRERTVFENAWEIEEGLYRILLPLPWTVPFVNAFVLHSQGEYMLVDAGPNTAAALRALGRAMKAIGVPARGLKYLLLTHRHPDHAGGAGPVQQRWGGRVLVHPAEVAYPLPQAAELQAWGLQGGMDEALAARVGATVVQPRDTAVAVEPLDLSQPLRLGDLSFDLIHVPGHSPGMVMLREQGRGWLLVADQVFPGPAPNVWIHPGEAYDPMAQYLGSLDIAGAMNERLILPSHGAPQKGGLPAMAAAMTTYHQQFVQIVAGLLAGGPLTAWAVVQTLSPYALSDPEEARFALSAALAALHHLEHQGVVGRLSDGRWESRQPYAGAGYDPS